MTTKIVTVIDPRYQEATGFTDYLRAIIYAYAIAKELNIEYKVCFNRHCDLSKFLLKKEFEIKYAELSRDAIKERFPCRAFLGEDSRGRSSFWETQLKRDIQYVESRIQNKEYHLYTSAPHINQELYGTLFNELFEPSEKINNRINEITKELNYNYVSISARFLNLLGEKIEVGTFENLGPPLTEIKKEKLICNALSKIKQLNIQEKFLLTSDSNIFKIRATDQFPNCINLLSKTVTNFKEFNYKQDESIETLITEMLLISKSKYNYLIKCQGMYNSGFSDYACRINTISREII